jgi:23S rRNA A2030 N6-methylase RlmJ
LSTLRNAIAWRDALDPYNPENRNAGNGGDLVKHTVYLAFINGLLDHQPWRDGMHLRECHAGRGMYALPAGDRRRYDDVRGPLAHAQLDARGALELDDDGHWYAGSALLNARCLARHEAPHRHTLFEWDPDTRHILSQVLAEAQCDTHIAGLGDAALRVEGERHIAEQMPGWTRRDVVLLDPFGLWRRPKLAERRERYRRIFEALATHPDPPALSMFFTWTSDDNANADIAGIDPVDNGYRDLAALAPSRIIVRWTWDIPCAMWLVVPAPCKQSMRDAVTRACSHLAVDVAVG